MLGEMLENRVRELSLDARIKELALAAGDAIDGLVRDFSFVAQCAKDKMASVIKACKEYNIKKAAVELYDEGRYREAADRFQELLMMEKGAERKTCYLSHMVHALVRGGEEEMNLAAEAYKAGDSRAAEEHMREAWSHLDPAMFKAEFGLRMLSMEGVGNEALRMDLEERWAYAKALKHSNPAEYSINQRYWLGDYEHSADFNMAYPVEPQAKPVLLNVVKLTPKKKMPEPPVKPEHPTANYRQCS